MSKFSDMTDLELATRLADPGQATEVFEYIVEQYEGELVLAATLHLFGDRAGGHDCTQETLMKCWRARHKIKNGKSVEVLVESESESACQESATGGAVNIRGWLHSTLYNTCIDCRRRDRRSRDHLEQYANSLQARHNSDAVDAYMVRDETVTEVCSAIRDRLSEIEQEVIQLCHNAELSYVEISTVTGRSVASVKMHLHRARKKLSDHFGPKYPDLFTNDE